MKTMKRVLLTALIIAAAATAVAQQPVSPTELTAQDVLSQKLEMARTGSSSPEDIAYLYLAQRADVQARVRADFLNAVNSTRTDVQIGAPSNAPGATSLVEKPGAADLLQLAVESGAVSETKNGTSVTLATTPYLLAGFFGVRDTPDAWRDYATLRHFAISATFSNDTQVASGDFTGIQSGEVKWTIFGNRSPRDAALAVLLQPELTVKVGAALIANNRACEGASGLMNFDDLSGQFATWFLAQSPRPTNAAARTKLDELFAGVTIDPSHQKTVATCAETIVFKQATAHQFVASMATMTAAYVALNDAHQLSLAVSSHRDATIDDFATVKVLYGRNTAPKLSINFNGEANFNQHHNAKNLHQLRSFAFEAGATMGRFNEGRFDATFSGKFWRDNASKDKNVGVIQVKANVYLANSLALPVSLTYANKEVETIKKGFQINLGIASLLDSFLSRPMAATP
jgi:hypothetical protein